MQFLLTLPAFLSFLMLAAHFLHAGSLPLAFMCLAMWGLLLPSNRWILRAVQVLLVLAAIEWFFTTLDLVDQRQAEGREWGRAAVILLVVAGFNLLSAYLLSRRLRRHARTLEKAATS